MLSNIEIKKLINCCDIISFDIFDTLLLRPYARPVDLFKHLEYLFKAEYFQQERIIAEKTARMAYSNQEDITYDQIYEFVPEKFQYLKQEEINLEMQILTPNARMKEIFDYAIARGKKIIIVSDMYLPAEVLACILSAKGFSGYDKLYVSGDIGKSKARGSLYKLILDEIKIEPNKILHIGDHAISDYKIPIEHGIKAVLLTKVIHSLFKINHRSKIFFNKFSSSLGASIILGLTAIALNNDIDNKKNYWEYFGFSYGGPICFSFMKFVLEQSKKKNLDTLLFIARDGYILQKVFNLMNTTNIEGKYVYAPRSLCLNSTLDYFRYMERPTVALSAIESLLNAYGIYSGIKIPAIESAEEGIEFINENKAGFEEMASENKQKYKDYFSLFGLYNKKIGLVDSVTAYFTAQKLIESVLQKNVYGMYWLANLYAFQDAKIFYDFTSFDPGCKMRIKDWMVVEFVMGSPEPPIIAINKGNPEYQAELPEHEKFRLKIFPDMEKGVLEFTKSALTIFAGLDLFIDNNIVTEWVNLFCVVPTDVEKKIFSKIQFSLDVAHSNFREFPLAWFKEPKFIRKIRPIEHVFSITNESRHKVIRLCGVKIKFKRLVKNK